MSYQIGWDTIHLKTTPRVAHTDYCSNDALKRHLHAHGGLAGADQQSLSQGDASATKRFEDVWEMDFMWHTNDGPEPWTTRGRTTDMGHADFLEGGVDRRQPQSSPFQNVEEVWEFDAIKEYGLTDFATLVKFYEKVYQDGQKSNPNQVFPGGYYQSIISGAIAIFGWDMLLLGFSEPARMEPVLESIFQQTMHHLKAWAKTSCPVLICHDDMVWSRGPFMAPDIYRAMVFPRYRQLWQTVKQAGKKLLYCSDGDFTLFIDDVAAAGADGFIFEPFVPLKTVVEKYGQSHVIIGSELDCRTLTFETKELIAQQVDQSLKLGKPCPGYMFAVGNHIPSNVPVDNALFYFEYLKKNWNR